MQNPDVKPAEWDAFVRQHGGGFLQSWDWSVFQEKLGRKVTRFSIGTEQDLAAQFTMITLPLPFGQRYGYVPRGPVARLSADPGAVVANVEACVEALHQEVARSGLTFVRAEWPWPTSLDVITEHDVARWGFNRGGHMQPEHTVINDLSLTEEALLAAMHQKTRYNIRVAEKHGVNVRETVRNDAAAFARDIDAFIAMLHETTERGEFSGHEDGYYRKQLECLASTEGGALTRLWLAEYDGRTVAGAVTIEFGGTVTYLHGASRSADRKVMGPYLLHWRIMQASKARGCTAYDFWGVAPEGAEQHSWAGITRFKEGFGGQRVSYLGAWELPGNGFWYRVYRAAKHLRR